jgi:hypothetical protein
MKAKTTRLILFISAFLIALTTFTGCVSKKNNAQVAVIENQSKAPNSLDISNTLFDINISINVSVKLDDSVKDVNPNIIKAARTAVFNFHCDRAKLVHYNGYVVKEQMNIFEVKEIGKDSWEVKYNIEDTPTDGYHSVTVNKENSGRYVGSMFYSSPNIRGDETF